MPAMNLNAPTYTLSASTTSSAVTLADNDVGSTSLIVKNAGSSSVFLVSGRSSAPTAVFPTSATVPLAGTLLMPGEINTVTKNIYDRYISGITASGTASVYIQAGSGE